ncbi:hypothetical protein PHYBOEH_006077 [Phytophthora boehmeriae]|uniref:Uncharacterized protein n=1 Tax=Phytophthora boehmeriae TaxID=109152 RepID=A0A8T1WNZ7_9STRA|nr:hypothetical protein PHYBOEH_006077 [Phytophthora boehmeriae]
MNKIDAHVKHYGKGKTRETRCAHCDRLFASRSKDRWRQHMRGCSRVPLEDRQYFTTIERRAFGRSRLSLTTSEAASDHLQSPVKSREPEEQEPEETAVGAARSDTDNSARVTSSPIVTSGSPPSSPVVVTTASPSLHSAAAPVASSPGFTIAGSNGQVAAAPAPASPAAEEMTAATEPETAAAAAAAVLAEPANDVTEVLLIHGPCSFVRNGWTGGAVSKADLLSEVQTLAAEAEVSLSTHESNHEGTILDWLLNARENEIIVLCWAGPLSESPMVVRALEIVKNPVIVVSTKGVEHGTLPSTVVGVMSGFGLQSIELALVAAKNISSSTQQ